MDSAQAKTRRKKGMKMRLNKRSLLVGVTLAVLTVSGCKSVQTTGGGAIGVDRGQRMLPDFLLSAEEVNEMSAQSYAQTLQQAKANGVLNTDAANTRRIRKIADRLIPQAGAFRPDAVGWKWEVNLENRDELNAYCAPGGKIMFFSGIINRLKLTDDEIAQIMGHEIAHALREHGRERMSGAYVEQMGFQALALSGKVSQQRLEMGQKLMAVALTLPNSRSHETEADRIGLELAARAGYNPNAAVSLWQKMAAASNGQPPQFLSTHPSHDSRINDLKEKIPTVLPLYEAAGKKR